MKGWRVPCASSHTRPPPGCSRIPGRRRAPRTRFCGGRGGGVRLGTPPTPSRRGGVPEPSPPRTPGRARAEQRPGWRFARPPRPSGSTLRGSGLLSSADAQPRDCASFLFPTLRGPARPADTPGPARPARAPSAAAAGPVPGFPHSPPDPTRSRPSGGRGGRSGSPSRAAVWRREVLNFTLRGSRLPGEGRPWRGGPSRTGRREFLTKAGLRVPSIRLPTPCSCRPVGPCAASPSAHRSFPRRLSLGPQNPPAPPPHTHTRVQRRTWPSLRPLPSSRLGSCGGLGGRCRWEVDTRSLRPGKAAGKEAAHRVGAVGPRAPWGEGGGAPLGRPRLGCSLAPSRRPPPARSPRDPRAPDPPSSGPCPSASSPTATLPASRGAGWRGTRGALPSRPAPLCLFGHHDAIRCNWKRAGDALEVPSRGPRALHTENQKVKAEEVAAAPRRARAEGGGWRVGEGGRAETIRALSPSPSRRALGPHTSPAGSRCPPRRLGRPRLEGTLPSAHPPSSSSPGALLRARGPLPRVLPPPSWRPGPGLR